MKAREHYENISKATNQEEFEKYVTDAVESLIKDIENLMTIRNAKTFNAKKAVIMEVNKKWKAIVNIGSDKGFVNGEYKLVEDGFFKILYTLPEYRNFIHDEIKSEEYIPRTNNPAEALKYIHKVLPLDQITDKNIAKEILACLASAGSAYSLGFPISSLKPLLYRIKFLEYWKYNGINYEEIQEFEADNEGFLKAHS